MRTPESGVNHNDMLIYGEMPFSDYPMHSDVGEVHREGSGKICQGEGKTGCDSRNGLTQLTASGPLSPP